jgi:hypothetical protein
MKHAAALLGDMDGLKLALAELLKTGEREHPHFKAFGLQPIPAFAATIRPAEALRYDAIGANLADPLKQPSTLPQHMVDIDDAIPLRSARISRKSALWCSIGQHRRSGPSKNRRSNAK